MYNSAAAKWTSTVNNKLLLDAGFSFNYEQYVITNQDGVNKEVGTPDWFAGASRRDADLVTLRSGLGQLGRALSRSLQHAGRGHVRHRLRTASRPGCSGTGARTRTRARPTPTCSRSIAPAGPSR